MGSNLRIVDVGSNILQFKFGSSYQRDWVENSGPWNFENNLLLLCRWKKGLTSANIVFSHSPFWAQLQGLPFELMSKEVGQDIGRSRGRFIEVDKRAGQVDQAKFIRIRVDLPIEKPLRRGGHVVSKDGEKYWVQFRYERLPTFCYLCGKLGHDDKHCQAQTDRQSSPKQYGEWLRANGAFKGGNARQKTFNSSNFSSGIEDKASGENFAADNLLHLSLMCHMEGSVDDEGIQNSKTKIMSIQGLGCSMTNTLMCQAADDRHGWDKKVTNEGDLKHKMESRGVGPVPIPVVQSSLVTWVEETSVELS